MGLSTTFDAIVIGAGIAGTATALELGRRRLRVALLDRHAPGWGASGRNPGFLWLQTKAAGLAMDFSLAARRFAGDLAGQLPDFGFRACGGLVIHRDAAYEPVARAFVADRIAAGLPVEYLDRAALRALLPAMGPEVSGAVWNPLDAHQDTRRLVRHLADAFEAGGGRILAPARAVRLLGGSTCTGVELADGSVLASALAVVAGGPWSNDLLAPLGLAIPYRPTRFEAAETAPAPFRIEPVVAGQALFRFFTPPGIDAAGLPADPLQRLWPQLGFTEQIASYPDGSLQFGCAYEVGSDSDAATVAGQALGCALTARNFPGVAKLPLTRQWAGIVAQTPDGLPVIDAAAGPDNLLVNAGHFFGNLAGAFSGALAAALAMGERPAYPADGFRLDRFAAAA